MKRKILIKKGVTICVMLFFALIFLSRIAYSKEGENFKPRFSIKLTGGLNYMFGGDINTHLKSYDYYLSVMTYYKGGKMKRLHYGSDLEGEIRFDISPKFAFSVGIEYISGKNKSYFEYRGPFPFNLPTDNMQDYIISPRVKIMHLKLGTYHTLPLHSRINLFFNTGIIFYFSKALLYKVHWSSGYGPGFLIYTKEEKYDVGANGLGFYGGIGFEYNIAKNLALVLEAQGRYARVNPKGERTSSWWEEPWIKEKGDLYIGERNLMNEGYGKYCPDLIISKSMPSGDEFQNIRKAVLNFSGFSLRAGIRIKLF